ncbi:MAG: hyaluronan synthase, partial [Thermoleophilales bacterium]|nr:hyaluronan synthase [Thermoleophilales bacterium]
MYTFILDAYDDVRGAGPTLFMAFFVYVWAVWIAKSLIARRYRPSTASPDGLTTTVIVPVYNEPEPIFRRALASVCVNRPTAIIAVIDGGDERLASVASEYCDRVLTIPKSGKRAAIATGYTAADPQCDIVVVLDSDTVWEP